MAEQQKNQLQDNQPQKEQDLGQLLKVRREKLAALQEAGKDPFRITKYDVTAHSRDIKEIMNRWKEVQCLLPDVSCRSV